MKKKLLSIALLLSAVSAQAWNDPFRDVKLAGRSMITAAATAAQEVAAPVVTEVAAPVVTEVAAPVVTEVAAPVVTEVAATAAQEVVDAAYEAQLAHAQSLLEPMAAAQADWAAKKAAEAIKTPWYTPVTNFFSYIADKSVAGFNAGLDYASTAKTVAVNTAVAYPKTSIALGTAAVAGLGYLAYKKVTSTPMRFKGTQFVFGAKTKTVAPVATTATEQHQAGQRIIARLMEQEAQQAPVTRQVNAFDTEVARLNTAVTQAFGGYDRSRINRNNFPGFSEAAYNAVGLAQ